jgi:hypothetical protein
VAGAVWRYTATKIGIRVAGVGSRADRRRSAETRTLRRSRREATIEKDDGASVSYVNERRACDWPVLETAASEDREDIWWVRLADGGESETEEDESDGKEELRAASSKSGMSTRSPDRCDRIRSGTGTDANGTSPRSLVCKCTM